MGKSWMGLSRNVSYFIKSENNQQFQNDYHGKGGLLNVSHNINVTPLAEAFIEACVEVGIPANPDFNGVQQEGAGNFSLPSKTLVAILQQRLFCTCTVNVPTFRY
jgi:choline dehydrogenase